MEINITKAKPVPPPPAPAAEPEPDPNAVPLTPEQIQARVKESFGAMGWPEDEAEAIAPTVDPSKGPGTDTPATPPPEPPPTPPAPEPEPEPAAEETTEELIRRTANETAEAMRRQQPPPEPPAAPAFEMSEDDADDLKALQFLESEDPAKYRGMAQKWLDYVKAHYAYQDKWETENPGKTYDQNEDEHAEFFTNHPIDVPDRKVLTKALVRLQVKEGLEESLRPQREKEKANEAWQKAIPNIAKQVDTNVSRMVTVFDPEMAKIVTGEDGKVALTKENVAKLAETDPIAASILAATGTALEPLLITLEKTVIPELGFKLNPANDTHALVLKYMADAEAKMAAAPAEVKNQSGKQWRSVSELERMRDNIRRSSHPQSEKEMQLEALDQRYWVLTIDQVAEVIVDDYAKKAKKLFDEVDAVAVKKYKKAATPAPAAAQPPAPASNGQPPANGGKPRPPSISTPSDVVSTGNLGKTNEKSFGETVADEMFK